MYPFMNVPRYSCCGTITYWKITKADGTVLSSGRATPEKVEGSFFIAIPIDPNRSGLGVEVSPKYRSKDDRKILNCSINKEQLEDDQKTIQ